jgi:hypothetical protein
MAKTGQDRKRKAMFANMRKGKVYYRFQNKVRKPQIKLGGDYLRKIGGFDVGDELHVTVKKGRITIDKVKKKNGS